jgi:DNA-binding MarR family transcriptional regulator
LTPEYLVAKNVAMEISAEFRVAPGMDQPLEEWSIPRLFGVAARMVAAVGSRLADEHGMSPAGFFLLRTLLVEDGLSSGEAARRCWTTPASTTSVADTLEREGYVERRRDGGDRRVVRLHLTDKGRQAATETQARMSADLGRLYDFIDPADEPAIRRFLIQLIERFGAAMKGDRP